MYSRSVSNNSKKRKSSALAKAVHPAPKRDRNLQHWWKNRSETALADDRRQLLEDLTVQDGVINGKSRGLVFSRKRAKRHPAANLLLKHARVGCQVLVGCDWNPDEMEAEATKRPHSLALKNYVI